MVYYSSSKNKCHPPPCFPLIEFLSKFKSSNEVPLEINIRNPGLGNNSNINFNTLNLNSKKNKTIIIETKNTKLNFRIKKLNNKSQYKNKKIVLQTIEKFQKIFSKEPNIDNFQI